MTASTPSETEGKQSDTDTETERLEPVQIDRLDGREQLISKLP